MSSVSKIEEPSPEVIEALRVDLDRISNPAAKPFPLLIDINPEEFKAFVRDIKDNGQQQPIVVDQQGLILDGRNRWLACKLLELKPRVEQLNISGAAAIAVVMSGNLRRRHEDAGARASEIAKLLAMMDEANRREGENFPIPPQAAAAKAGGISRKTLGQYQSLRARAPEIADEVEKSNITLNAGRSLAKLAKGPEREQAIQEIRTTKNKRKAKGIVKRTTKIVMPGMTGRYATLLQVLKNLRELPNELRNLHKEMDAHRLSSSGARQLKDALTPLRKMDFKDLLAAVDVAVTELDRVIKDSDGPDSETKAA